MNRNKASVGRRIMGKRELDLLDRLKRGDEEAFDTLFREHRDMVLRVAYRVTGELEAAKDISQEVFLRAHSSVRHFEGRSSFSTWLYRMTFNAAVDQRRKRRFLPLVGRLFEKAVPKTDPLNGLQQDERRERLRRAIPSLPAQQGQAVVLRVQEDLPYSRVAEVMGIREDAARALVYQATKRLKKMLKED